MIYVIGYRDKVPEGSLVINTTSRCTNWSRGLSPFFLNPGKLYGNHSAKNVENAWQYSKVYKEHLDDKGNITDEYFYWAKEGWNLDSAVRYPMGKDRKPEFSYWDGNRYDYITARKKIYAPLYSNAVKLYPAYNTLKDICRKAKEQNEDVYLLDFDGYNHIKEGTDFKDVVNNPDRKMGHAFVLWYMLSKEI